MSIKFELIKYENSYDPTILSVFYRMQSESIIKLHYYHTNKYLQKMTTYDKFENYLLATDLEQLRVDTVTSKTKIIFMLVYGDFNILTTVSQLYPDHQILYFTLDYPKVYGNAAKHLWKVQNKPDFPQNVFTIEVNQDKWLIEKYVCTFFANVESRKVFGLANFPDSIFDHLQINDSPINKILLSGNYAESIYPERFQFSKYCVQHSEQCIVQSENYPKPEYLKYIQSFIAVYAGPVNWISKWIRKSYPFRDKILTTKCWEIMATGALLIIDNNGCKKELDALGFIHNQTCIHIDSYNPKEVVDFVTDLQNRPILDKIREAGKTLIAQKYTEKHFVDELANIFNQM
jgi:hypothetical protein